jgi:putative polyhydroxyalkanoate system protein
VAKKVYVRRPHGTTKSEAESKLAGLTSYLEERYGVKILLRGANATVSGRGVKGAANVDDTHVTVDLKLGIPASLVAGKIEAGVNRSIDEHFNS